MKTLLTAVVIAFGAIVPATQASAAPVSQGAKAKTYGGFAVGKKFSFKVTEAISAKQTLGGKPVKCPVPKGMPNFKKGQKVTFTIGKKGELTGPGFSINFYQDGGTANAYANKPTSSQPQADVGQVFKTSKNAPTAVALNFFDVSVKGFSSTTYIVSYTLE